MTTIDKKRFARAVRAFRAKRDITQDQLANMLATKGNTVARWERGECAPKSEYILRQLKELGIT